MRIIWQAIALLILLNPVFPVVEYVLNYEYISTELCENKDKPELECNGKCYLMQSLAKQASKENDGNKKGSRLQLDERTLLYFKDYVTSWTPFTQEQNWAKTADVYAAEYTYLFARKQYRPPIV